jgi:hypothetical protein
MKREINLQKLRLLAIYVILAVVVVFEWNFIKSGLLALPVLNSVIIGVFILGNVMIWRSLLSLDHEIAALGLIAEAYQDTHSGTVTAETLALRRQRCDQKGHVFKRPILLGSAFNVLMDEFWRGRSLRFRLQTVQMLTSVVDHKLARDRSVIGYTSGLAIFLGLIGTFIGLMEMVHSVGGIVGSLAGANASAESIQNLIKALQAPLTGMAQGFSASLFGLFASLVLGLMGRFAATASYSVKEQFENWLTSVSQMEEVRRSDRSGESPTGLAFEVATGAPSIAIAQPQPANDKVAGSLARVADAQGEQARQIARLAERFEALAINHAALDEILRRTDRLVDALQEVREATSQEHSALRSAHEDGFAVLHKAIGEQRAISGAVEGQIESLRAAFDARLDATERRLRDVVAGQRANQAAWQENFDTVMQGRDALNADLSARQADLVAGLRRMEAQLAMAPDPTLIGSSLRGVLLEGFADIARKLEGVAHAAQDTVHAERQSAQETMLAEMRSLTRALEISLGQGLNEVAAAFQNGLQLYLEMMRQAGPQPEQRASNPLARDAG